MKVLFLIPTLRGGGAERVLSLITMHLNPKIEKVVVLYEKKISYPYKGKLVDIKVPALPDEGPFYIKLKNIFLRLTKVFFLRLIRLKKIIKEERPHVVLSFMESANALSLFYKIFFKPKIRFIVNVRTLPSCFYKGVLGSIYKMVIRLLYNHADCIIANSKEIREDLIKSFGVKEELVKVIFNPYDIEGIKESCKEEVSHPWFKEDIPILVNMGRLDEQKGQLYLLRAFSKIKKELPCRLIILGEGPLRKNLEEEAEKLKIKDDVEFFGFQYNPFKYLKRCSIFVFPSLVEGFPNALIEAMICGLPVLSFACRSGPAEILKDNEYGILVPLKDQEALTKHILQLLKDKDLYLHYRKKAEERAGDFSLEKIIPLYEEVIEF